MAQLIERDLRYRPDLPDTAWRDLVKTYRVGDDVTWQNGRLKLPFEGNRVDVIAAPGTGGPAQVLIDGRAPSTFPGCYAFTRTKGYPKVGWPCIMRVQSEQPLVVEEWRGRILEHDDALKGFRFEVVGSVTGPDGQGHSTERFVSNSGRVVIDPDDWFMWRSREYTGVPLPEGFEVTWRVEPHFVDSYTPPQVADATVETVTTVAQGLPNGPHELELVAGPNGPPPLAAVRVYRPPLGAQAGG